MLRRAKPVPDPDNPGQYLPNGAAAKTGLNKPRAAASSSTGHGNSWRWSYSSATGRTHFTANSCVRRARSCCAAVGGMSKLMEYSSSRIQ